MVGKWKSETEVYTDIQKYSAAKAKTALGSRIYRTTAEYGIIQDKKGNWWQPIFPERESIDTGNSYTILVDIKMRCTVLNENEVLAQNRFVQIEVDKSDHRILSVDRHDNIQSFKTLKDGLIQINTIGFVRTLEGLALRREESHIDLTCPSEQRRG